MELITLALHLQGMMYLHKSVFQSHGYLSSANCHVDSRWVYLSSVNCHVDSRWVYLSSANCHVDSRWVLKISGFALHAFRKFDNREQVTNNDNHHHIFVASINQSINRCF